MNKLSEEELFTLINENNADAVQELVGRYKNLVCSIANRYQLKSGDRDDLIQEGQLGLLYAIYHFDSSRGSFSSFAGRCIESNMIKAVDAEKRQKNLILNESLSLDYLIDEAGEPEEMTSREDDPLDSFIMKERYKEAFEKLEKEMTPLEWEVYRLSVVGFSDENIASMLSRSQKSIDNAKQRARQKAQKIHNLKD